MIERWDEVYAPRMRDCAGFGTPSLYELPNGDLTQICPSTGVFYAPPLTSAALLDLLFEDEWSIIPPG